MQVRRHPRVSLNLDGDGHGGHIVVLIGDATIAEDHPLLTEDREYLAKYTEAVRQAFGD